MRRSGGKQYRRGASLTEGRAASCTKRKRLREADNVGGLVAESQGNRHWMIPMFSAESKGGIGGVRGLKRDSEIVPVENGELTWETRLAGPR